MRCPFVPGNWYAVLSQPDKNATGKFSGGVALAKSLDPFFHGGNFTDADALQLQSESASGRYTAAL